MKNKQITCDSQVKIQILGVGRIYLPGELMQDVTAFVEESNDFQTLQKEMKCIVFTWKSGN